MDPRHSNEHTTRTFYDRISGAYDLIADASEHSARDAGLAALGAAPGEVVLEIGFGTGHALEDLARAVGSSGRVAGVDLSSGMMEVARRRLEKAGLEQRVELKLGDARDLPYRDGSFDAVFLSFTLELFEGAEIPQVLAEIRRVLRSPGAGSTNPRLGVVSLTPGEHPGLAVNIYRWFHRHFPHFVDCQPIPVVELLEAAGFEILHSEEQDMWHLPVAILVARPAATAPPTLPGPGA
ncbi:MAG: methyltransferase domain-containing protein [Acidobacteriota bacterium]|nr:methyltransferase domain-containing protein [Acidobacteriota bacterium]